MGKTIYNGDTLIKIVVRDKRENQCFEFKPFKKRLLWANTEEGFYETLFGQGPFSKEDLEEANICYPYNSAEIYQVEDNKVFYRPSVTLFFANDHSYIKEFDTYEKALQWAEHKANICIGIQLIF